MKANKTYVAKDGTEYFMCPFTRMYITQGSGTWSHTGAMAVDVTNGDTSKAPLYAPATAKCMGVYPNAGQTVWKSTSPVYIANGKKTYVWFCIAHDDSLNAYVGMVVKQGQQIANMGVKGVGTGVHCHFEVGASADNVWGYQKGSFSYNGVTYPVYGFKNEPYDFEDVCYMDDTNILSGSAKWKYTGSSQVSSTPSTSSTNNTSSVSKVVSFDNMESENWAVKFLNDTPIVIHSGTSNGGNIGTFVKGETQVYTRKGAGGGHRWIGWEETINGTKYKCVCAISGSEERGKDMWVELIDPATLNKKPTTNTTTNTNTSSSTNTTTPTKSYQDSLDDPEQPDLSPEILASQHGLNINVSLVDKKNYRARCPYVMKPEVIVIHNAATPNGTAKALCVGQNKEALSANDIKSWHFSVDEKEVWQSLPLNRNGFHASDGADGTGNRKGIAIEIARDLDGEEQYYEASENNGALLAAILLNKYGWDVSHLKTHHDYARDGKWCPHKILDNGWDKFVAKVQGYLDEIQGKNKVEEKPIENNNQEQTTNNNQTLPDLEETNNLLRTLIDIIKKILSIFGK